MFDKKKLQTCSKKSARCVEQESGGFFWQKSANTVVAVDPPRNRRLCNVPAYKKYSNESGALVF